MDRLPPRHPARGLRRIPHGSVVLRVSWRHSFYALSAGLRQGHGQDRASIPQAGQPAALPRVLLFFSLNVEADHVLFAADALKFFAELADKHAFRVEATSNWADMNDENLRQYKLVVWLNSIPPSAQHGSFER